MRSRTRTRSFAAPPPGLSARRGSAGIGMRSNPPSRGRPTLPSVKRFVPRSMRPRWVRARKREGNPKREGPESGPDRQLHLEETIPQPDRIQLEAGPVLEPAPPVRQVEGPAVPGAD